MAEYMITTAVGTGEKGFAGDGGPAHGGAAQRAVRCRVRSRRQSLFLRHLQQSHPPSRRGAAGSSRTVAGNGEKGYSGDGGPATEAALNEPYGIVVDRAGNLYIADRLNRRVRRIDAASGIITTLAGTGEAAYGGDGGPAARAGLGRAERARLRCQAETRLYITDVADNRVRVVDLASGMIATFAGTGAAEHSGDGGPATRGRHVRRPRGQGRRRRDGLHPRTAGQQPARGRSEDRDHHDDRRHHRARLCAATAARRSRRCSTRRRRWRSTATAASSSSIPRTMRSAASTA